MFPAGPVTLTQMTSSRDGVEIAYATYGAGEEPAVVLVHGWAGNRTYWDHQIDDLAERYQVIAVDLGGHGESGLGRDDWNLAAFGTMSSRSSTRSAQTGRSRRPLDGR